MSLGLGDLKKKTRSSKSTSSTTVSASAPTAARTANTGRVPNAQPEKFPAGAWSRSSTQRPWTSDDLARPVKSNSSRRRVHNSDAVMNDAWMDSYTQPAFDGEWLAETWITKVYYRAYALEAMAREAANRPRQFLENVFGIRIPELKLAARNQK